MANDKVTIAISAKDNYSVVMEKISQATKGAAKDMSSFQKRLDVLNSTKLRLQVEVEDAKKRLREAKRVYEDSQKAMKSATDSMGKSAKDAGDALNGIDVEQAKSHLEEMQEEYNNLSASLSAVSNQAKETERSMRSLNGTGKGGGQGDATLGTLTKTIASSQLAKQVLGALGDSASAYISSAYGEKAGLYVQSTVSGALSGMSSGAAIGSMIAPGIGTVIGGAIGAAVGAGSGALSASTQIQEEKDAFFKDLVRDKYTEATEKFDTTLDTGKTIAGSRETDMLAFKRLLGGEENAKGYLNNLVDKAAHTPFQYDDLTAMSKTLATFGYSQQEMLDMIDKVGDTGAALGMDSSGMVAVATYLGRMKSSNKTSLEYLNPLIERGIPVMDYLAKSLRKSKEEVYDMISKGLIPGEQAAKVIADYMGADFKGSMEDMSHTYDGMLSTIEDYQTQLQNAMGDAYNEERKTGEGGLQDQIDWYDKNADEMSRLYSRLGKWKAEQDNAADKILFDTYQELLDSDWENMDEGDLYAKLLASETEAAAKYTDTEQFTEMKNAQLDLVERLRVALADSYYALGYELMLALTKGLNSVPITKEGFIQNQLIVVDGISEDGKTAKNNEAVRAEFDASSYGEGYYWLYCGQGDNGYVYHLYDNSGKYTGGMGMLNFNGTGVDEYKEPNKAFGLSYVPYNDYPARLHEGERVLTASQNREYMSGGHGGVTVNISSMTVRSESDIDSIADELYRRIRLANANYSEVG